MPKYIKIFLAILLNFSPISAAFATDAEPPKILAMTELVAKIISFIAPVAGIGFFLMLVYAGYQYIFSFGDPGKAGKARSAMLTAIIGLVVLVLIYLVYVAIGAITGCNVLELNFGGGSTVCPNNTGS